MPNSPVGHSGEHIILKAIVAVIVLVINVVIAVVIVVAASRDCVWRLRHSATDCGCCRAF